MPATGWRSSHLESRSFDTLRITRHYLVITMIDLVEEFERERDLFDSVEVGSVEYRCSFQRIVALAQLGVEEAVGMVAELAAFDPTLRDPKLAYKFYNILMESEGSSVAFDDFSDDPNHYQGAVGDFRNEAQVSELVSELGKDVCREIDKEADEWRARFS